MTGQHLWTAAAVLGVLLLARPAAAGQASMLNSSEASAFMGVWVISFESPRGGSKLITHAPMNALASGEFSRAA